MPKVLPVLEPVPDATACCSPLAEAPLSSDQAQDLAVRLKAVADPARAQDRDPVVQVAARGQAVVSDRAQGRQAAVAMPLVTFRRARSRTRSLPAATQASPAVAAEVAVREQVVVAVAARVVVAAVAAVAVVVAAVAAAVGDQISRSNTTSSFSAISPMASVFIASAITGVTGHMLA